MFPEELWLQALQLMPCQLQLRTVCRSWNQLILCRLQHYPCRSYVLDQAMLSCCINGDLAAARALLAGFSHTLVELGASHHEWFEQALRSGSLDLLELLLGSCPPAVVGLGLVLLMRAAARTSLPTLQWLQRTYHLSKYDLDGYGPNLLHFAAHSGDVSTLRWLLERGCRKTEYEYMVAIKRGHVAAAKLLCCEDYSFDYYVGVDLVCHWLKQAQPLADVCWLREKLQLQPPLKNSRLLRSALKGGSMELIRLVWREGSRCRGCLCVRYVHLAAMDEFAVELKDCCQRIPLKLDYPDALLLLKRLPLPEGNRYEKLVDEATRHDRLDILQWLHGLQPISNQLATQCVAQYVSCASVTTLEWLVETCMPDCAGMLALACQSGSLSICQLMASRGASACCVYDRDGRVPLASFMENPVYEDFIRSASWMCMKAALRKGNLDVLEWLVDRDPALLVSKAYIKTSSVSVQRWLYKQGLRPTQEQLKKMYDGATHDVPHLQWLADTFGLPAWTMEELVSLVKNCDSYTHVDALAWLGEMAGIDLSKADLCCKRVPFVGNDQIWRWAEKTFPNWVSQEDIADSHPCLEAAVWLYLRYGLRT
jgi:hypothetical protein